MANDLLIAVIRASELDIGDVAQIAGADPRTVQRWLGGRVPHPRYRAKLAAALNVDEHELWPDTRRARTSTALEEIVAAVPRRGDPDTPDWRALLHTARQQIDLLGNSLHHITSVRQANKLLVSKARSGCAIRVTIADPNSPALAAADAQSLPAGRLIGRVQASHRQLLALAGPPGIELRQHHVATTHTILRFDDQMLLTLHLYATPGFQAPVLQLQRQHDYGLFDQFAKHFQDVWAASTPLAGQTAESPARSDPVSADRDAFLDELDRTWRPAT